MSNTSTRAYIPGSLRSTGSKALGTAIAGSCTGAALAVSQLPIEALLLSKAK